MKRKTKVYLDTSVISALFDEKNPQRQILTQRFFENIGSFDTYVSEVVLAEIGDTRDAQLRNRLREVAISFNILSIYSQSQNTEDCKYAECISWLSRPGDNNTSRIDVGRWKHEEKRCALGEGREGLSEGSSTSGGTLRTTENS
ncbi:MAG: hypothetical protein C4549_09085 [Deltaproteobacteria bacterium]|nr:MAG: hypothetical protein C4549_09085 [Deltaproteobacteria bacterium]